MNKPLILLPLFLIATMCFVTMPNSVQADSQLDVLIKITQNTQAQIKKEIDKLTISQYEKVRAEGSYDEGIRKTVLLTQAVENGDDVSAKQHFIDAMIAFKRASLAISENQPQAEIVDHSSIINKYANNIQKLKIISTKLKADIDFEKIDHLLALAKANNAQGKLEQAKDTLNEVASEGKKIQKLLYEISEENKILKAKQFVQKHAERIKNLILQAKTFGLDNTANELQQSQIQLLQANTTNQIKQQFKIIIIHQQKVEQIEQINTSELLRLQSLIEPLENKAKRLADDLQGNNAAANLLDNAFNLIEKTKQDIQDLQYVSGRIDTKNLDLTIGKNIETIKDLLMKVEKLIYTSS